MNIYNSQYISMVDCYSPRTRAADIDLDVIYPRERLELSVPFESMCLQFLGGYSPTVPHHELPFDALKSTEAIEQLSPRTLLNLSLAGGMGGSEYNDEGLERLVYRLDDVGIYPPSPHANPTDLCRIGDRSRHLSRRSACARFSGDAGISTMQCHYCKVSEMDVDLDLVYDKLRKYWTISCDSCMRNVPDRYTLYPDERLGVECYRCEQILIRGHWYHNANGEMGNQDLCISCINNISEEERPQFIKVSDPDDLGVRYSFEYRSVCGAYCDKCYTDLHMHQSMHWWHKKDVNYDLCNECFEQQDLDHKNEYVNITQPSDLNDDLDIYIAYRAKSPRSKAVERRIGGCLKIIDDDDNTISSTEEEDDDVRSCAASTA